MVYKIDLNITTTSGKNFKFENITAINLQSFATSNQNLKASPVTIGLQPVSKNGYVTRNMELWRTLEELDPQSGNQIAIKTMSFDFYKKHSQSQKDGASGSSEQPELTINFTNTYLTRCTRQAVKTNDNYDTNIVDNFTFTYGNINYKYHTPKGKGKDLTIDYTSI